MKIQAFDKKENRQAISYAMHTLMNNDEADVALVFANGYEVYLCRKNKVLYAEVSKRQTWLNTSSDIHAYSTERTHDFLQALAQAETDFDAGIAYGKL